MPLEPLVGQSPNDHIILRAEKEAFAALAQGFGLEAALHIVLHTVEHIAGQGPTAGHRLTTAIWLLHADQQELRFCASPSLPKAYRDAAQGYRLGPNACACGRAVYNREPVVVPDITESDLCAGYVDLFLSLNLRAAWSTPIMSSLGSVLGTFAVYYQEPHEPSAEDRSLIARVTQTVALLIEKQRADEALRAQQAALRDSEQRLSAILNQLPMGVGLMDCDGRWVVSNALMQRFMPAIIPSRDPQRCDRWRTFAGDGSLIAPSQWPSARALAGETVSPGMEFLYLDNEEQEHWVRMAAAPFRNEEGTILGAVAVVTRIDELKRAEEALKSNEDILRQIFRTASVGMCLIDEHRHFAMVNPEFAAIVGYAPEEMIGMDFTVLFAPEQHAEVERGYRARLEGDETSKEVEVVTRFGERRIVQSNGSRLLRHGDRQFLLAVVQDISQRKRIEEALRDSEERARAIVESIADGFMALDLGWRITYVNAQAEHIVRPLKKTRTTLIGKLLWEEFPDLHGTVLETNYRTAMEAQQPVAFEAYYAPLDGWYDIRAYPFKEGLAIYFLDITDRTRTEKALHRMQDTLLRAQRAAQAGLWEIDLSSQTMTWSTPYYDLFGLPHSAPACFETWIQCVHPDDRLMAEAAFRESLRQPGPHSLQFRIVLPDGTERWVQRQGDVLCDEAGQPLRIAGISLDITDRKLADIRLTAVKDRLALELADMSRLHELSLRLLNGGPLNVLLTEVLKAAVDLTNTDKGNVQLYDAHEQALKIVAHLGFNEEFLDYFKSVPLGYSVCGTAMANHERIIMEDAFADPRFSEFAPLYAKHGFVAVQSTPLFGSDGRLLGMLSNHFSRPRRPVERELRLLDLFAQQAVWVIERDRAETVLRQSEERLRLAMAAGHMGAWELDLQTGAVTWDAKQHELFGRSMEDAPRTLEQFYSLVCPADMAGVRQSMAGAEFSGRLFQEFRIIRADGCIRWLAGHGTIVTDPQGRPLRLVGVNYDITERKEAQARVELFAEELEREVTARTQELRASQERLRAMANELSIAEQRERKRLATELHDHLQQMLVLAKLKLGQGKRLAQPLPACAEVIRQTDEVLSEALTYTRTLVAELSPPVLREHGLPAALKWLGEYMKRHDMAVTVQVPENDAVAIPEDLAVLLFQAVRELLINASKHAGSGEAAVSLGLRDGSVQIQVRDHGRGFDPAAAVLPGSEHENHLSSKFGLFSIRERMLPRGGNLAIASSPGQGTLATLTMPLVPTEAETMPREDQPHNPVRPAQQGLSAQNTGSANLSIGLSPRTRILLVDDHAMFRQGLRTTLDAYADMDIVGEASNGEEALTMAETLRPSVVVMDINMPRMNGIQTTAHLKHRYPDMVVIGLSVNTESEDHEAMKAAGAAMLLSKEAIVEQLYAAIRSAEESHARSSWG